MGALVAILGAYGLCSHCGDSVCTQKAIEMQTTSMMQREPA